MKEKGLTKSDLRLMHSEYNQMYFGGKLSMPEFVFFCEEAAFREVYERENC